MSILKLFKAIDSQKKVSYDSHVVKMTHVEGKWGPQFRLISLPICIVQLRLETSGAYAPVDQLPLIELVYSFDHGQVKLHLTMKHDHICEVGCSCGYCSFGAWVCGTMYYIVLYNYIYYMI